MISLERVCCAAGSLFIHGHSLAENDEHVLRRVENSKVEMLFISLHGKPGSTRNRKIQNRAELMVERRVAHEEHKKKRHRTGLEIAFYDADSAAIWNSG